LSTIDFGYFVRNGLAPEDQIYVSAAWTRENISSRGPFGALYRVWGDGKQMVKGDRTDYFGLSGYTADQLRKMGCMVWMPPQEKGSFLGEGDTPTFMNLLDNGLRAYEDRHWSGWGGNSRSSKVPALGLGSAKIRPANPNDPGVAIGLAPAGGTANQNAKTATDPAGPTAGGPDDSGLQRISPTNAAANARLFAAAQNDFAVRLKWSITPKLSDANHEPKVRIKGPLEVSAQPGSTVRLEGEVADPDHNTVKVTWWQDNGAGTYSGDVRFSNPEALSTTLRVPNDAQPGNMIHVILEAADNGTPPLTRYQRVIVRIQ
jgi:Cellulose-binding protein Sde0182, C-terminal domain/Cellulose-binding Sde182, nucleoside hydrolase-like domain